MTKNVTRRLWEAASLLTAIGCIGCSAEGLDPGEGSVAEVRHPIVNEQAPDIAARTWWRYAIDPDQTLVSYASARINGCSATMIGPEAMITAAHCGERTKSLEFITYDELGSPRSESFGTCEYLIHGFREDDVMLFRCPGVDGVRPGDKYGYVDLDLAINTNGLVNATASRAKASLATSVYSIWQNPITDLSTAPQSLYSFGVVTNPAAVTWAAYGGSYCDNTDDAPTGIAFNVWGRSGASGSGIFSAASHRYLGAPTTTGSSTPNGAAFRVVGGTMGDIMLRGRATTVGSPSTRSTCESSPGANDGAQPHVNATEVTSTGLDPNDYLGWFDGELDGMFDVQRDLEALAGETSRNFYWLGFDSNRSWRMWEVKEPTATDYHQDAGYIRMTSNGTGASWNWFLSHRDLNLDAGTYSVKFAVRRTAGSAAEPIRLCLGGSCEVVTVSVANAWVVRSVSFSPSSGASLYVDVKDGAVVDLREVSISRTDQATTLDFDNHDSRDVWRNGNNNSGRALIWPSGNEVTNSSADWAGVVRRDTSRTNGEDWPLRSDHLGFSPGSLQRVCFTYRASTREPLSGPTWIGARIVEGHGPANTSYIGVSGTVWQSGCTSWTRVDDDYTSIAFGMWGSGGAILVDDVTLETL